jgi:hypothetical protein
MAEPIVEIEVADARRSFSKAQELLAGVPFRLIPYVEVGWYDTAAHPEDGCFALVREEGPYTDLVGEVLRVTYGSRPGVFVYVIGGADIPQDLALYRRAFLAVALLTKESIGATVEVVQ